MKQFNMKSKTFFAKAALMLLAALFSLTGARAETLTVYDGNVTSYYTPAYIFYFDDYARSQFVIPAAQLSAMNGCTISALTFYTNQTAAYVTPSVVDVYLKEVNTTTLNAFEAKSGIVYQGMLFIAGNGELTITFKTPYVYNGSNLLIGIENTTDVDWKYVNFYGSNGSNGSSIYGYSTRSLAEVTPTRSNFIPKTTFTYSMSPINVTATPSYTSANITWAGSFDSYEVKYRKAGFFDDFENGLDKWTIYTEGEHIDGLEGWFSYNGMAASYSWSEKAYDANNWLVTPAVELNGTLKFDVLTHPDWADSYEVLLSTTGNDIDDFTVTLKSMATAANGTVTIDLSAYAGQTGYIAIHHVSNNRNYLDIDNFEISSGGEWKTKTTTATSIELTDLEMNTDYEYIIIGKKAGSSDASTVLARFTTLDGAMVTIAWFGYSTLYYGEKNLKLPPNVEAYTYKKGEIKMVESHYYGNQDVIPAGTAVVLKGEPGNYIFPATDESGHVVADNELRGFDVATQLPDSNTDYYYVLSVKQGSTPENGGASTVGFYWNAQNGGAFTSAAHKAYLVLPKSFASVKSFYMFSEDEPTGLNDVNVNDNDNESIYNLAGQRIGKMQRGINIVNGKKILK